MTLNQHLSHKYKLQLDLLYARNVNSEPLRADEMIVQISRDEYQALLELSCEALRARNRAFAAFAAFAALVQGEAKLAQAPLGDIDDV